MPAGAGQVEKLERLLEVTRQMAATTDLTQLLGIIVDATRRVLDCERATIFLYDKPRDELYSRVATGVESIRFSARRGIAGAAASERKIVNVPDAYADERFNREIDRQTGFRTRNLLTFPLENLDRELMGVLQALNKVGGPFGDADERLALVLSAQAGVALHRQRLIEEYALKQRMARDLELARKIQLDTFPKTSPVVPGYEIAGWNQSADETGGDCYDFMPLNDGRLAVMLADATGHGIPSALIIAQCRAMTRAMLSVTRQLQDVTSRVNQLLVNDIASDRFVTAFLGILDAPHHRLEYIAAGQGPIIFIGPDGPKSLPAGGLPFAVLDEFDSVPEVFDFAPGSMAVLLTDGFFETEAPDSGGEQFGDERVIEYLLTHRTDPLDELIAGLHDAVRDFRKDGRQLDDLTAVLIRRRV